MREKDHIDDKKLEETSFKHQYRTTLGIINDILQACMDAGAEGVRVSRISQKANLSHNTVVYNCQRLIDADMVRTYKSSKKNIFVVTDKGIRFFHELQRFQNMIRAVNIRY